MALMARSWCVAIRLSVRLSLPFGAMVPWYGVCGGYGQTDGEDR